MAGRLYLGYHYVRDELAPGPTCSPARLRQQIVTLLDRGYKFFTCWEVSRHLKDNVPLPEKYAVLTFDDGLKDHAVTVLPLLQELGVPATFFVITCAIEREIPPVIGLQIAASIFGSQRLEDIMRDDILAGTAYARYLDLSMPLPSGVKQGERPEFRRLYWVVAHLLGPGKMREAVREVFQRYIGGYEAGRLFDTWCMGHAEIRTLSAAGMEIGSHTVTHPLIPNCGSEEVEWELSESRRQLEELLGRPPRTFAWTYGGTFSERLQHIASKYYLSSWNFLSALTAMPEPPYDRHDMPRLIEHVFDPK